MPRKPSLRDLLAPPDTAGRGGSDNRYGSTERQRSDSTAIMDAARAYLDSADEQEKVPLLNAYASAERGRAGTLFNAQAQNLPEYQGLKNQMRRQRDSSQFVNNTAFQRMLQLGEQADKMYRVGSEELSRERAGIAGADANKAYEDERQRILQALGLRLKPRG
jgi:hypothetical protein